MCSAIPKHALKLARQRGLLPGVLPGAPVKHLHSKAHPRPGTPILSGSAKNISQVCLRNMCRNIWMRNVLSGTKAMYRSVLLAPQGGPRGAAHADIFGVSAQNGCSRPRVCLGVQVFYWLSREDPGEQPTQLCSSLRCITKYYFSNLEHEFVPSGPC